MDQEPDPTQAATAPHPFAARFADAWAAPTLERLTALLTDDVELIQPLAPTTRGKPAAREAFARILTLVPDLHAVVHGHSGAGDCLTIQFELAGTLAGKPIRWQLVDVFELEGELARRRTSYFDPTPLIVAILTRPGAWLPYARSGLWRR